MLILLISVLTILSLPLSNAGSFFYVENKQIPTRNVRAAPSNSQPEPAGGVPTGLLSLVPPAFDPNPTSLWVKYAQNGQNVFPDYQLGQAGTRDQRLIQPIPPPGFVIAPTSLPMQQPVFEEKVLPIGSQSNHVKESVPISFKAAGKVEEFVKDASDIRQVIVQAPGRNDLSAGSAESSSSSSEPDYQDYYEYEYEDSDFPDSNPAQLQNVPSKPTQSATPAVRQSAKETTRKPVVVTSNSASSEVSKTVIPVAPKSTTQKIPQNVAKAIDSSSFDVIRVGAAYATDLTPRMKPPTSGKDDALEDDFYAYDEDSSEFVDDDDPLTSEINHFTSPAPVKTTVATTTTTTTESTTPSTTTRKPAPTRKPITTKSTTTIATIAEQQEYEYYDDEDAIPPWLKNEAKDEPILSKITQAPPSTTMTTSTTTTTTTTTPTTTTTTSTTTTESPPPPRTQISTTKQVSVSSSVGRSRRPRIKSTTSTTTTEADFSYDEETLPVEPSPEPKPEIEQPKDAPAPPEDVLQTLVVSTIGTSAPVENMRPTTYRPRLNLTRYLKPTPSNVFPSPIVNVISKVDEKSEITSNDDDDSSSWLGELLKFPHASPDADEQVVQDIAINSSTSRQTADPMQESASSTAEFAVEEITTPSSTSTTPMSSSTQAYRRGPGRAQRRKNARVRVAIRRQHQEHARAAIEAR